MEKLINKYAFVKSIDDLGDRYIMKLTNGWIIKAFTIKKLESHCRDICARCGNIESITF